MTLVAPLPEPKQAEFQGFEEEVFLSKHSHMYGSINLYAPVGPVEQWGELPWLLTTKHGEGGQNSVGLRHIIKASAIQHALNHVSLIGPRDLYVGVLQDEK